jgi:hypothetical protein
MTPTSSLEGDLSARLNQVIIVLFYPLGSTLFSLFITYLRYRYRLPYLCIDPDLLVGGIDPRIRIRAKMSWIRNNGAGCSLLRADVWRLLLQLGRP